MNFERFPGAQYANIFSYLPSDDREGYAELDEETLQLVGDVPGYVGYESVKNAEGRSIFISYWHYRLWCPCCHNCRHMQRCPHDLHKISEYKDGCCQHYPAYE